MDIWQEVLSSINDVKLGFIIALVMGFGFYRLSKNSSSANTKAGESEDSMIVTEGDDDDYKMVLVVRNDLKMGKGKVAAQCAHAAVAGYQAALKNPKLLQGWEESGHRKITVKVDSVEELDQIKKDAKKQGLIAITIQDAGRTQIAAGSKTVCCVGPAHGSLIDQVTGHLKLY